MTRCVLLTNFVERSEEVSIPAVGVMVRIERKSFDGAMLDIEYRWPPLPTPGRLRAFPPFSRGAPSFPPL